MHNASASRKVQWSSAKSSDCWAIGLNFPKWKRCDLMLRYKNIPRCGPGHCCPTFAPLTFLAHNYPQITVFGFSISWICWISYRIQVGFRNIQWEALFSLRDLLLLLEPLEKNSNNLNFYFVGCKIFLKETWNHNGNMSEKYWNGESGAIPRFISHLNILKALIDYSQTWHWQWCTSCFAQLAVNTKTEVVGGRLPLFSACHEIPSIKWQWALCQIHLVCAEKGHPVWGRTCSNSEWTDQDTSFLLILFPISQPTVDKRWDRRGGGS